MKLAARVQQVTPSLTLAVSAKANAMQREGFDVCSFSAGEPDFDTPEHIKNAAIAALKSGKTRYGPAAGEPQLRAAIARKLVRDNHLPYKAENILVTNGGKHSLYNLMMTLIEAGDEVIIPAPYWVSYPEMVKLADGTPVIVETTAASGYKITPEQLRQAITPKTKLFVLNSPSNPTGMVYTPDEIRAIAQVAVEHDLLVVSDEIYEKLLYNGAEHLSIGAVSPEMFARTIISNGFAKAYAMTGWRVGYLAAPVELIAANNRLQSHSTSNVCTFAQYGAIAALEGPQECVETMRLAFEQRRSAILQLVEQIPGLSCPQPDGAFYVFIDIAASGMQSLAFCDALLEEKYVAAVPGVAFGADDSIRLSYATDMATIEKGLARIAEFMRIADLGGMMSELPPLNTATLWGIIRDELDDATANRLVWHYLGYREVGGIWNADAVNPDWREKYPEPPDFIENRPPTVQLTRSIPAENKQLLKDQLGFEGYKLNELIPRKTRRATMTNWLLSYMQLQGMAL